MDDILNTEFLDFFDASEDDYDHLWGNGHSLGTIENSADTSIGKSSILSDTIPFPIKIEGNSLERTGIREVSTLSVQTRGRSLSVSSWLNCNFTAPEADSFQRGVSTDSTIQLDENFLDTAVDSLTTKDNKKDAVNDFVNISSPIRVEKGNPKEAKRAKISPEKNTFQDKMAEDTMLLPSSSLTETNLSKEKSINFSTFLPNHIPAPQPIPKENYSTKKKRRGKLDLAEARNLPAYAAAVAAASNEGVSEGVQKILDEIKLMEASTSNLTVEQKKRRRLLRNRASAQLHRERKKNQVASLGAEIDDLHAKLVAERKITNLLRAECSRLGTHLDKKVSEVARLKEKVTLLGGTTSSVLHTSPPSPKPLQALPPMVEITDSSGSSSDSDYSSLKKSQSGGELYTCLSPKNPSRCLGDWFHREDYQSVDNSNDLNKMPRQKYRGTKRKSTAMMAMVFSLGLIAVPYIGSTYGLVGNTSNQQLNTNDIWSTEYRRGGGRILMSIDKHNNLTDSTESLYIDDSLELTVTDDQGTYGSNYVSSESLQYNKLSPSKRIRGALVNQNSYLNHTSPFDDVTNITEKKHRYDLVSQYLTQHHISRPIENSDVRTDSVANSSLLFCDASPDLISAEALSYAYMRGRQDMKKESEKRATGDGVVIELPWYAISNVDIGDRISSSTAEGNVDDMDKRAVVYSPPKASMSTEQQHDTFIKVNEGTYKGSKPSLHLLVPTKQVKWGNWAFSDVNTYDNYMEIGCTIDKIRPIKL